MTMEVRADLSSLPWEPTLQAFRNIPEEAHLGQEKIKLPLADFPWQNQTASSSSFPKGSRVGCYYYGKSPEDKQLHWRGGMLGAVVHDSSTFDNLEHVLVTFLEDGLTTWLPSDWCLFHGAKSVWEAGPFLYNIWHNTYSEDPPFSEFHLAFRSLNDDFPHAHPALFTYWQGRNVEQQDENILKLEKKRRKTSWAKTKWIAVDPRLADYLQNEHPSIPVYHALSRKYTIPIDDKYYLYQVYQANDLAASVFPPTFGSIREALEASNHDDEIFFVKDRGGSQGQGIRVLPRRELANEVELSPSSPSVVIQRAVPDILTIDTDGPLMGRRFDIRYFFVVFQGNVYMHSNAYAMWPGAEKPFDPKDPTTENHVPKVAIYTSDAAHKKVRDYLFFPANWQESQGVPSPRLDPISWRKEIAVSLSKARSTLAPLISATVSDPYSYHVVGGDAIIQRSGRAVLMEFNDWPDYTGFNERREPCLEGILCLFRIVFPKPDGSYILSPVTPEFYSVFSGYTAQLFRDMAALVMGLESPKSLERFHKIEEWNESAEDTCKAS